MKKIIALLILAAFLLTFMISCEDSGIIEDEDENMGEVSETSGKALTIEGNNLIDYDEFTILVPDKWKIDEESNTDTKCFITGDDGVLIITKGYSSQDSDAFIEEYEECLKLTYSELNLLLSEQETLDNGLSVSVMSYEGNVDEVPFISFSYILEVDEEFWSFEFSVPSNVFVVSDDVISDCLGSITIK